jgi:hypothetical protein
MAIVIDCATGEAIEVADPVPTLAERKAAKRRAINTRRDRCFAAGYTPASGPLQGHTLQTRDVEDRTNWLTSQAAYSAAVANGAGAVMGANFRTADNETVTMSYADGLGVLLGMAAWGAAVMGNSWSLKDAVDAAADDAALDAIDTGAGWL